MGLEASRVQPTLSRREEPRRAGTVRLILGDQLHSGHSWYIRPDDDVLHVMMEVRSETDYAVHHIQKVLGFFGAMRRFADGLRAGGHRVLYLTLDDSRNVQEIAGNLRWILDACQAARFEHQLPDEHRVDAELTAFAAACGRAVDVTDTEHSFTTRGDLAALSGGGPWFLMERFYRKMRERTGLLMEGGKPAGGRWNFDRENRQRPPADHVPPPPLLFAHDLRDLDLMVRACGVRTIGSVEASSFPWPLTRDDALELLAYFCRHLLPRFGSFQDAMSPRHWALHHSRLSFALNSKLLTPMEVCRAAEAAWRERPEEITLPQVEGFVRQILGWREYMRGVYWATMPDYARTNFFQHDRPLPSWYWTGQTRMACLRDAIEGSLERAYAHHIQRLMLTGNFALLSGVHPDEVDRWYLGIYIDAIEWVEITNTRGMSQFADGGMVGTKPYVSSGAYVHRMGHYCGTCEYDVKERTGESACPLNALYWHFHHRNRARLEGPDARPGMLARVGNVYRTWDRMAPDVREALLKKADALLADVERL